MILKFFSKICVLFVLCFYLCGCNSSGYNKAIKETEEFIGPSQTVTVIRFIGRASEFVILENQKRERGLFTIGPGNFSKVEEKWIVVPFSLGHNKGVCFIERVID